MNIRVAAAVLKQALSLMQSMPTKTEMPEMPNLDEYKVSVAEYFSPMEAPAKRAPKMTLIQEVRVPGKEEVTHTGVGCISCIPPDGNISTNPNTKAIEEIAIGDKVLDRYGEYSHVEEVFKRDYNGDLINITVPYQKSPITLTPEHPVLAVKLGRCRKGFKLNCLPGKDNPRCNNCLVERSYKPEFIPAKELSTTGVRNHWVKHALLSPRLKETNNIEKIDSTEFINIPYRNINGDLIRPTKGHSGISVKRYIDIDNKFLKLAGFYLSEGHVHKGKRGSQLLFTFGKNESSYTEETTKLLQDVFGVKAKTYKPTLSTIGVRVCSHILGNFFTTLFSTGALNKEIPKWILTLPSEKQIALIEGYFRGDGSVYQDSRGKNAMVISGTTVSKKLAYSLRIILHRIGIIHNLSSSNTGISYIDKREIKGNGTRYVINIGGPSAIKLARMMGFSTCNWRFLQSHLAGIDNNWIYLPIKKVEKKPYSGFVYNLSTTPSNTFTVNGAVVHNCSRDHISTVTAVLNEAMRFAREGGLSHPEVQRRIELAIDELNVMERIDAAPDALLKLPPKEKAIMDEFLPKARRIRQRLGEVKSVNELEQIAADSHAIRMELRVKKSGLSEQMISKVKSLAQEVNEGKITKEEAVSRLKDMQENGESPELSTVHAKGKTVPPEQPSGWVYRKPYPHELRFTLTPKQYQYLVSELARLYRGHPLPLEHLKLYAIRYAEVDFWVQISDTTALRIAEEAVSRLKDTQKEKPVSALQKPGPMEEPMVVVDGELEELFGKATRHDLTDIARKLEKETDTWFLPGYIYTKEAIVKSYLRWIAKEPKHIGLLKDKLQAISQEKQAIGIK